MSDPVRLGIVGCGRGGTQVMYAPILRFLEGGQVTALVDPDPAALAAMLPYCPQASTFSDYDSFLVAAEVDAAIIATPVSLHREQVIKAAQAGKHVLCEKPLARTVGECDVMIKACAKRGVILMTAFMKRFDKSFRLAKEMIESGALGQVFQVRCDWSGYGSRPTGKSWREWLSTGGGVFQDHGSHTSDLCRWWLGDVVTVSGEIGKTLVGRQLEDVSIATLRHASGALSLHHLSVVTHTFAKEYYLIDGTRGSLEIQGPYSSYVAVEPFRMLLYEGGRSVRDVTLRNDPNLDDERRETNRYLKELEHFCTCIQTGSEPLTKGEDGRAAIEIVNAVYLSSWKQNKVHLPLREVLDLQAGFGAMQTFESLDERESLQRGGK